MKFTKLSLVAAVAASAAFAGGDIAPVEPVVEAVVVEVAPATTISGKATAYGITDDSNAAYDLFEKEASQLGLGVTLDVSHKLFDNVTANFSAVGYVNTIENGPRWGDFEGDKRGAFFNVANLTATYADTTLIAGRQLLDTPMLGGFDWLLAPGAFEAYTIANKSIENVTLIGSYVNEWRQNNTGDNFINLTDKNWALGAVYGADAITGSVWYYNVDHADYKEVYIDAGYDFGIAAVSAQYVNTNYGSATTPDSNAYGLKVSGNVADINLYAAYNRVQDNTIGYVGIDSLYTSSWNTFTSAAFDTATNKNLDAFKIGASTTFAGISAELSYADYNNGNETDLILGYNITKSIDTGLVYTNTKANVNTPNNDAVNAIEVFANYKF